MAAVPFLYALLLALTAYGVFSMYNPERAFRVENPFQVNEVELSEFGVTMQVIGGFVVVLITGYFGLRFSTRHWLYPISFVVVVIASYFRFRENGLGNSEGEDRTDTHKG